MKLPGSSAYLTAFMMERILAFLLMKFLIQDVSPETFGIWTQLSTTSALLSVVLIFRLDNGLITSVSDVPSQSRKIYFAIGLLILLPSTLFICVVFYLNQVTLSLLIFGQEKFKVLLLPLLFFSFSEAALYLVYGYLRSLQRSGLLSSLYFLRFGVRSVILMLMLVNFDFTLETTLFTLSLYNIFLAALFFLPGKMRFQSPEFFFTKSKVVLRESSAQLAVVLLYWAAASLDRYVLLYFSDISALTAYAFLLGIAAPIALLPTIMQQTLLPALSNLAECDEAEFRKLSSDFFMVNIFIGVGATLGFVGVSDFLIEFLGTNEFPISLEHIIFASILMFTSIVDQIFSGILTAQKRAIKHSQICVLTTISLLIFLTLMVPHFGLLGALYARLFSSLIQVFLMLKMLQFNLVGKQDLLVLGRWILSGFIMLGIIKFLSWVELLSGHFLSLLLLFVVGLVIYLSLNFRFFSAKVIPSFLKDYKP